MVGESHKLERTHIIRLRRSWKQSHNHGSKVHSSSPFKGSRKIYKFTYLVI